LLALILHPSFLLHCKAWIGVRGEDLDALECNFLTIIDKLALPARAGLLEGDNGGEKMQLKSFISPILLLRLTNFDCKI